MQPGPELSYRHIQLEVGIWKSVCLSCFRTAADAERKDDLKQEEGKHICKGIFD